MKKLLCLLLALLMIVSVALVACGDKNDDEINYNDDDLAFNPTQSTDVATDADTDATTTKAAETTAPVSTNFTEVNEKVYVQNCVQANLRSTPSATSDSNIKCVVDFGSSYTRVKYNELWSGIEVDGEILYINTYFLTTKPDEVVFNDVTMTLYVTNIDPNDGTLGNLKLRTFTSTNPDLDFHPTDNVGAIAKHGAKLDVTGKSSDGHWYRVNFTSTDSNGKTTTVKNLYVWNGKYVTETNPIVETDTTPAATPAAQ